MESVEIWDLLLNQGVSFVLLALGIWWFNNRNTAQENRLERQQEKIDALYAEIAKIHEEDKERLMKIIERHSDALDHMTKTFERVLITLKS